MCFFTSIGIENIVVNGLILPVELFSILLDHFLLILILQREATRKYDNIDNSENTIKVYQELISRACATEVHNWSGFEGSLPL
jgi:hypothetical protein